MRGAKCQVGTFAGGGVLAPLTIPCPGINPKLFIPFFSAAAPNVLTPHILCTLGASDGVTSASATITETSGVTTTNPRRKQSSTSFVETNLAGASIYEATASFVDESVVLTPTLYTHPSYGQGGYLIIGS